MIFTTNTRTKNTPAELRSVECMIGRYGPGNMSCMLAIRVVLRFGQFFHTLERLASRVRAVVVEITRSTEQSSAGAWRTVRVVSENHGFHRAELGGEPLKQIPCRTAMGLERFRS